MSEHHIWSRARSAATLEDRELMALVGAVEVSVEHELLDRGPELKPLPVTLSMITVRGPWRELAQIRAAVVRGLAAAGLGEVSVLALPVSDG